MGRYWRYHKVIEAMLCDTYGQISINYPTNWDIMVPVVYLKCLHVTFILCEVGFHPIHNEAR